MAHRDLPKIRRKLERLLKKHKITRQLIDYASSLMYQEAWAESWQKDDWPHA